MAYRFRLLSLRAKRSNLDSQHEIASSRTQVGLARLAHIYLPISGKPEIGRASQ
jgi:hypothetical protein